MNERITSIEGYVGSIDGRVGSLGSHVGSLESHVGSLQVHVDSLERHINSMELKIDDLREELLSEIRPIAKAVDKDAKTIIDHEKRITRVERLVRAGK